MSSEKDNTGPLPVVHELSDSDASSTGPRSRRASLSPARGSLSGGGTQRRSLAKLVDVVMAEKAVEKNGNSFGSVADLGKARVAGRRTLLGGRDV